MHFKFHHNSINVLDLDKSLKFYREALGLEIVREKNAADGSYKLLFLGDGSDSHQLELTWLKEKEEPYNLGDNESHLAFKVDDYTAAHDLHQKMNCICYENEAMGLYFISDPDGYWIEILPLKRYTVNG